MSTKTPKKKKSIDFEEELLNTAEAYAQQRGIKSVSVLINDMIRNLLALSPEVRQSIAAYALEQRQRLNKVEVPPEEAFRKAEIVSQMEQYANIERFFGDGSITPLESDTNLNVIKLADGYGDAVIPNDWTVLNEDEASSSKYAYVFEARNGAKYGVGHFVYFGNEPYVTEQLKAKVVKYVYESSESIRSAFTNQFTEPVMTNFQFDASKLHQWSNSFVPAVYMLPIENAKNHMLLYGSNGFPYDAHIRRPDGYDFSRDDEIGV